MAIESTDRQEIAYSHAARGLFLTGAAGAERFALPPNLSVGQGLRIIVGNCVAHIQANAPGVSAGDMECVHQMRVGLRRLRVALEMFAEVKPCPSPILAEQAWLADQLGQARDWGILAVSTLPAVPAADVPGWDTLQGRVQRVARQKYQRAAAAVDSVRSARLWLLLERWLTAEEDARAEEGVAPLVHFAARSLLHRQRKLRARCAAVQADDQYRCHRLRIAAKKLRYATEFFLPYYPAKPVRRLLARLAALQEAFGTSNDMAVADRLLRDLAQKHPDLLESAAYARGYLSALAAVRLDHRRQCACRFAALKKLRQHITEN